MYTKKQIEEMDAFNRIHHPEFFSDEPKIPIIPTANPQMDYEMANIEIKKTKSLLKKQEQINEEIKQIPKDKLQAALDAMTPQERIKAKQLMMEALKKKKEDEDSLKGVANTAAESFKKRYGLK